jgi:hypothetical protein
MFRRSGDAWVPDGELSQGGYILSLDGDTLLTTQWLWGSPDKVHVYRDGPSGWTEEAVLTTPIPTHHAFGWGISLSGETALVGAQDSIQGANGIVHVYERDGTTWSETGQLVSKDSPNESHFGWRVALLGDEAAVATQDWPTSQAGVYVYRRLGDTWIGPPALEGQHVALAPGRLLTADFGDQSTIYRVEDGMPYCTAGTSAGGCQAILSTLGGASATSASGFFLAASGAPEATTGLFYFGANGRQAAPWGNGTSFQCVVPPVSRGGLVTSSGLSSGCAGVFVQDLNQLWCPTCPKPAKNPGPGALVQAQLWYRDPFNTSNQTTSLSDAIEFVVSP